MKLILIIVFFIVTLHAQDDINKKISATHKKLSSFSQNKNSINKKMEDNAKAIIKQRRELRKQTLKLAKLKKELKKQEKNYSKNKAELGILTKSQNQLQKVQDKVESELIYFIAQSVSLSVILEEEYSASIESLMEYEVLDAMLKDAKAKTNSLNKKFYANSQSISSLKMKTENIKKAISQIDTQRKDIAKIQKENKLALKKLEKDKKLYKKSLKNVLKKQDLLKNTLANLNIIKIDALRKAKEEKARKLAFEKRRQNERRRAREKNSLNNNDLPNVKQVGSSYQTIKTKRYVGRKTIAPLSSYKITKKYGTYTDPIYGIKIFNESISLKPKRRNAKVRTVFNGKVIYADKTAVLNNIVIVEHSNGLHTIYANLSQIAPSIRKGKKIKKGYTIGRVKNELIFEVTQKSDHINPIRLFR
jgi:murein DD-endopeptidase MepM/ murein hydrolase activator NlpD